MNRSRAKGTAFETDVVRYMNAHGFPYAERRALAGNLDKGDITGVPGWVFELKNCQRIELGEFMSEAETEAVNARCADYAVIVKRRRRNVADAYAVLPLWLLVDLVAHDARPDEPTP